MGLIHEIHKMKKHFIPQQHCLGGVTYVYLSENESFSKTILGCLSGAQVG